MRDGCGKLHVAFTSLKQTPAKVVALTEHYTDGTDHISESGILVTLTGDYGRLSGWPEAREDLGLNKAGPEPVEGVEIVEEHEVYYDEDEQQNVAGYEKVVLLFEDVGILEDASDRLFEKATERFEWGIADSASDVQNLASQLPTEYDVKRSVDTETDRSEVDSDG